MALVIVTGYRRVIREVRQDTDVGKLMLAYFVLALIYNFTEAGFKMMNPVWVFFLLAIMAIPKSALSAVAEATPALGADEAPEFAEFEPHFKQTRNFG